MNKNLLKLFIVSLLLISSAKLSAQATGFSVSTTKCNSLELTWTSNKACIVVGKEGGLPDFIPSNNNSYAAKNAFNLSGSNVPTYGTKCYVVANSIGVNSVVVDSLKPCTTYYFTIYEHNNKGASTQYDTASSRIKVETYCLNLAFQITYIDSCQSHNQYQFKNRSISTIPGISYQWDFGDGLTATDTLVKHSYTNKYGVINVMLKAPNTLGCPSSVTNKIRIYPKKVGVLDSSKAANPQCLRGNYYEIDVQPIITPLPKSFTYFWKFGDGDSNTFKKMKHSYKNAGNFYVTVVIQTNVNLAPTGCSDTLRYVAIVRQGPNAKVEIKDSAQCLTGNSFTFESKRFYKTKNKWYFGDGNSDTASTTVYQYGSANSFNVLHILIDSNLCTDTFRYKLRTLSSPNSSFSGLDTAYCVKDSSIKLSPSFPYGQFYGYPVKNNLLPIDSVGNYQLKYAIRLKNCSDSTIKNFKIKSSCFPSLGANLIISSGQSITLDAGVADAYLWNTGATTRTILVEGSKLTPGSNLFIVKASNKNGCYGIDTIIVGRDYFSNINAIKQTSFNFYPNPVSSSLHFTSSTMVSFDWMVYNLEGKLLIQGNDSSNTIDFSAFEKGLYIIEFSSGDSKEIYKISKD